MGEERPGSLRPFLVWLALFYAGWGALVFGGGELATALSHWPIAVAMALGSYVAGSTPMGGGTIGFPVLVLIFDQPAELGRNFSFCVQSIGMTSAGVFILSRRLPIARHFLLWAIGAMVVVVPAATLWIVPRVPDLAVKLLFAVLWGSFGVVHLLKLPELVRLEGEGLHTPRRDRVLGLAVGVAGGVAAALTGVSIDMLLYMVLVLLLRTDLRIAIPTSVLLMAATSLVGVATHLALGDLSREVYGNWLAAAPVVALGAPLGAWVVTRIGRAPTLLFVSLLCLAQLGFTLWDQRVSGAPLVATLVAFALLLALFRALYDLGRGLARRSGVALP
ncbi:MAG: sulfite exporter TauE/SafE family protein [Acidobacteria bacterium]|nr:sulfite exporter TauE/SafE family protein [Acidobacteriota bacterium]MCB9379013.1 sulfite exporter TauE/SafE family protein [Holophagales bacterium]